MLTRSPDYTIHPRTSAHLDAIRSCAALAVVASHLRTLFFADFTSLASANLLTQILYFLTGFGHAAVMVFFVLSGLLVSQGVFKQVHKKTWSLPAYLIQRFSRLLIVLWPALLLTLLWDLLGTCLFGIGGIYGGNPSAGNVIAWIVPARTTWPIYLGNAFFLQTVTVNTAGSNGPLIPARVGRVSRTLAQKSHPLGVDTSGRIVMGHAALNEDLFRSLVNGNRRRDLLGPPNPYAEESRRS